MSVVKYLSYQLTLKSPAILSGLLSDPNTVSTLRYIPGSMLRGVVARELGDPQSDPVKLAEFNKLVLNGTVCWLHALPVVNGQRAFAVPSSFRKLKHESSVDDAEFTAFDLLQYDGRPDPDHEITGHWPEETLTGIGNKFLDVVSQQLAEPSVTGRLHQQRHRPKGRAWTDRTTSPGQEIARGTIYAYESLDKGQSFAGCLKISGATQLEVDATIARVQSLLGEDVLLGRSKRSEYGADATLTFQSQSAREWSWSQTLIRNDVSEGQQFVLLATSTCLVRDPLTGQTDPAAWSAVIKEKFGADAIEIVRVSVNFEQVGAFNRKWRLEVPQIKGVAAGSSMLIKAKRAISLQELTSLEDRGIGERRAEGFGRVVFIEYSETHNTFKLKKQHPNEPSHQEPLDSQLAPALVRELEARLVTNALRRQIDLVVGELLNRERTRPSNSLLGRLREPLRDQSSEIAASRAIGTLKTWLDDCEENPNRLKRPAMDQLRKRCLNQGTRSQSLGDWLQRVVRDDESIIALLRLQNGSLKQCMLVSDESVQATVRSQTNRLKVQLIDSVLANLTLLNRRAPEANNAS